MRFKEPKEVWSMNRNMLKYIPMIIWIIMMLSLSSRPAIVSAEDSKPFEHSLTVVQEKIKSNDALKINLSVLLKSPKYLVRKTAHVILYCGLFVLTSLAFLQDANRTRRYIQIFLFCICYACFDEIYQTFIPGRTGLVQDVLIDSIGIVIGCCMTIAIYEVSRLRRNKIYKFILGQ